MESLSIPVLPLHRRPVNDDVLGAGSSCFHISRILIRNSRRSLTSRALHNRRSRITNSISCDNSELVLKLKKKFKEFIRFLSPFRRAQERRWFSPWRLFDLLLQLCRHLTPSQEQDEWSSSFPPYQDPIGSSPCKLLLSFIFLKCELPEFLDGIIDEGRLDVLVFNLSRSLIRITARDSSSVRRRRNVVYLQADFLWDFVQFRLCGAPVRSSIVLGWRVDDQRMVLSNGVMSWNIIFKINLDILRIPESICPWGSGLLSINHS